MNNKKNMNYNENEQLLHAIIKFKKSIFVKAKRYV